MSVQNYVSTCSPSKLESLRLSGLAGRKLRYVQFQMEFHCFKDSNLNDCIACLLFDSQQNGLGHESRCHQRIIFDFMISCKFC